MDLIRIALYMIFFAVLVFILIGIFANIIVQFKRKPDDKKKKDSDK